MNKLFNDFFAKLHSKSDDTVMVSEKNGMFSPISYSQLEGACYMTQRRIGLAGKKERIAIIIENRTEFIIAFLTAIYSGYSVVAINPDGSREEKEKILNENEIKKVLTVFDNNECYSKRKVFCIDKLDAIEGDLLQVETNQVCIVSYTSGTSGKFSKGVKLTYENIYYTAENYKRIYRLSESDKIIIALPLWHNYGMIAGLCSAFEANCKILLLSKWDSENFIKMVEKYKPTVFPGSPYMYLNLSCSSCEDVELQSLRICDSGGDMLPVECIEKFEEATGAVIIEGYGLTETSSLTHFNYSARERRVGSIGKCVEGVNCKIKDLDGHELGINEWGLLHVHGKMVFSGYVNTESDSLSEAHWFNTNDIVKVDTDGYYYISGRYSDIKKIDDSADNNRRIENDVYKHPMVERAYVKRINVDSLDISCYKIYVQLKDSGSIHNFMQYIREKVSYAVIDEIIDVNEFALTSTGKVKRSVIN